MNQITIFAVIFLSAAIVLVLFVIFLGKFEFRRFLSYGFPEAWEEILHRIHPQYKQLNESELKSLKKEILIKMGQLDFDTHLDHFTIEEKLRSCLLIVEQKLKVKKVIGHASKNGIEGSILYIQHKKNEES